MKKTLQSGSLSSIDRIEAETVYIESSYQFLIQQNGLRPGKMHVILGASSGGKSTLVRSLIFDTALKLNMTNRILVWLSEESIKDFQTEFNRISPGLNYPEVVEIYSEMDTEITDINYEKKYFDSLLSNDLNDFKVVVLDNITTSKFFADKKPDEQAKFISYLKKKAIEKKFALVIVAHTQKGVSNFTGQLVTMDHIQGTSSTTKLSEFFYVLQTFYTGDKSAPVLSVAKCRGQEAKNKFFLLKYDHESRFYNFDVAINFEEVKQIWKLRNKLGD